MILSSDMLPNGEVAMTTVSWDDEVLILSDHHQRHWLVLIPWVCDTIYKRSVW